jgi:four helix bundle protein
VSSSPPFESLRVWHDSRRLTFEVYQITRAKSFVGDRALRDQMRRAAISVMSNIAEGYERDGSKEFVHFLRIAKGSAGEIRCQLYAAEDLGYLPASTANTLRQHAAVVSREIASLIQYRKSEMAQE